MRHILKVSLAVVFAVLLAELVVRFFSTPPMLISFVASDPVLGHKGPENSTVMIWNNKLQYNSAGFRVIFPPKGAKLGDHAVAFLGDSMVEAISISDRDHFASLFAGSTHLRPYVLAAGDWGTAQEWLAFRNLHPEHVTAVVLAFSSLTDFANNGSAFAGLYQSKVDFLRPYLRATNTGTEVYYLRPLYHALREYSRLFLAFDNLRISRALTEPVKLNPDCKRNPNSIPLHVYFTDETPEWRDASISTELAFRELAKDSTRIGAKPLAVYLPNDFELLDEKWEESVKAPAEACWPGRKMERRENERKFLAAAKAAGLPAESLYDFFRVELSRKNDLFLPDGHFNEAGHEAFSRGLLAIARKRGLID